MNIFIRNICFYAEFIKYSARYQLDLTIIYRNFGI
jgi:hypothetical protein